jgi:hypothetical protein
MNGYTFLFEHFFRNGFPQRSRMSNVPRGQIGPSLGPNFLNVIRLHSQGSRISIRRLQFVYGMRRQWNNSNVIPFGYLHEFQITSEAVVPIWTQQHRRSLHMGLLSPEKVLTAGNRTRGRIPHPIIVQVLPWENNQRRIELSPTHRCNKSHSTSHLGGS